MGPRQETGPRGRIGRKRAPFALTAEEDAELDRRAAFELMEEEEECARRWGANHHMPLPGDSPTSSDGTDDGSPPSYLSHKNSRYSRNMGVPPCASMSLPGLEFGQYTGI